MASVHCMCVHTYIHVYIPYIHVCINMYICIHGVMPYYPCTSYFAQRLMKEGRKEEDKKIKEGKKNLEQLDLVITRLYDT